MTNITNAELTQMKERAEETSFDKAYVKGDPWKGYEIKSEGNGMVIAELPCETDAQFIAHAREDVPRLVAEVERLRNDNGHYFDKIKRLKSALISAMSLADECPECVKAFLADIYEEEFE